MAEMLDSNQHLNIELDIIKLNKLINHFNNKDIVICTDSNSWSSLWGCDKFNSRGENLDEFIKLINLKVSNNNFSIPTFYQSSTSDGRTTIKQSFIDITMFRSSNVNLIRDWSISDKDLGADHRLITFEISLFIVNRTNFVSPLTSTKLI